MTLFITHTYDVEELRDREVEERLQAAKPSAAITFRLDSDDVFVPSYDFSN